jgi:hypothetical protein
LAEREEEGEQLGRESSGADLGSQWRPKQDHTVQQREGELRPHTTASRGPIPGCPCAGIRMPNQGGVHLVAGGRFRAGRTWAVHRPYRPELSWAIQPQAGPNFAEEEKGNLLKNFCFYAAEIILSRAK